MSIAFKNVNALENIITVKGDSQRSEICEYIHEICDSTDDKLYVYSLAKFYSITDTDDIDDFFTMVPTWTDFEMFLKYCMFNACKHKDIENMKMLFIENRTWFNLNCVYESEFNKYNNIVQSAIHNDWYHFFNLFTHRDELLDEITLQYACTHGSVETINIMFSKIEPEYVSKYNLEYMLKPIAKKGRLDALMLLFDFYNLDRYVTSIPYIIGKYSLHSNNLKLIEWVFKPHDKNADIYLYDNLNTIIRQCELHVVKFVLEKIGYLIHDYARFMKININSNLDVVKYFCEDFIVNVIPNFYNKQIQIMTAHAVTSVSAIKTMRWLFEHDFIDVACIETNLTPFERCSNDILICDFYEWILDLCEKKVLILSQPKYILIMFIVIQIPISKRTINVLERTINVLERIIVLKPDIMTVQRDSIEQNLEAYINNKTHPKYIEWFLNKMISINFKFICDVTSYKCLRFETHKVLSKYLEFPENMNEVMLNCYSIFIFKKMTEDELDLYVSSVTEKNVSNMQKIFVIECLAGNKNNIIWISSAFKSKLSIIIDRGILINVFNYCNHLDILLTILKHDNFYDIQHIFTENPLDKHGNTILIDGFLINNENSNVYRLKNQRLPFSDSQMIDSVHIIELFTRNNDGENLKWFLSKYNIDDFFKKWFFKRGYFYNATNVISVLIKYVHNEFIYEFARSSVITCKMKMMKTICRHSPHIENMINSDFDSIMNISIDADSMYGLLYVQNIGCSDFDFEYEKLRLVLKSIQILSVSCFIFLVNQLSATQKVKVIELIIYEGIWHDKLPLCYMLLNTIENLDVPDIFTMSYNFIEKITQYIDNSTTKILCDNCNMISMKLHYQFFIKIYVESNNTDMVMYFLEKNKKIIDMRWFREVIVPKVFMYNNRLLANVIRDNFNIHYDVVGETIVFRNEVITINRDDLQRKCIVCSMEDNSILFSCGHMICKECNESERGKELICPLCLQKSESIIYIK
jgi:hypothetical protein